jgi:hypothetical protein
MTISVPKMVDRMPRRFNLSVFKAEYPQASDFIQSAILGDMAQRDHRHGRQERTGGKHF